MIQQPHVDFVLLLDDDEANNFFHEIMVRESGITDKIIIATNAEEAIFFLLHEGREILKDKALIFLDINMPAINGWEFLEEIRVLGKEILDKLEIIMLSASDYPKDIERIKAHDLLKTFIPKMLSVDKIKKIFEEKD